MKEIEKLIQELEEYGIKIQSDQKAFVINCFQQAFCLGQKKGLEEGWKIVNKEMEAK